MFGMISVGIDPIYRVFERYYIYDQKKRETTRTALVCEGAISCSTSRCSMTASDTIRAEHPPR